MATETPEQLRTRARRMERRLAKEYSGAGTELNHSSAFELLIATILSAQCTDAKVNEVTAGLFPAYPTPEAFATADREELEAILRPTGFFRQKTESVMGASRALLERFGGQVPSTMDDLTSLPGVARKTANVVLGQCFGKAEGVVVDTHVRRLSQRMGFTPEQDPQKIERDLMEIFPRGRWIEVGSVLILHGRRVCAAKKPLCGECGVAGDCPKRGVD